MSFEAPAACTLPTTAQPLRVAEFTALDIAVPVAHTAVLDGLSDLATTASHTTAAPPSAR